MDVIRAFLPDRRSLRVVALAALLACSSRPLFAQEPFFDTRGFQPNRQLYSQMPYEHIDPLTGNLLLSFTDLVLPGNAGLDLKVVRTYNSKIYKNYQQTGDLLREDSWAGIGWTLHFGRIFNGSSLSGQDPVVEMPDGSQHKFYRHIAPPTICGTDCWISRDYWIYDRNTAVLHLPNGVKYTFNHFATATDWYATLIRDPYGNEITISYANVTGAPGAIEEVVQRLSTSQTRRLTFGLHPTWGSVTSMTLHQCGTFGTCQWTYTHESANQVGQSRLTGVDPPDAPNWEYAYTTTGTPQNELTRVTTPQGGTITYTYNDQDFRIGTPALFRTRVVTQRVTGGALPTGTTTFAYAQGSSLDQTLVTEPCRSTRYTFIGVGSYTAVGAAWRVGLISDVTISSGGTPLQTEERTWKRSEPISNTSELIGNNNDAAIYVPLLEISDIARGTQAFKTTFSYHTTPLNDYGQPYQVAEDGDIDRTTVRTFKYGFTPYIIGRLEDETITIGARSAVRSWTYELSTGFLQSETRYGIVTNYSREGNGNIDTVRDANNHTTSFDYDWGVKSQITTPVYGYSRSIRNNGTMASETRRTFTTTFTHDRLGRLTGINPPAGPATAIAYTATTVRTDRGHWFETLTLDGAGRIVSSVDSVNVRRRMTFDACGRESFRSLPYVTGSGIGTTLTFDGLDRVEFVTNPDGTSIDYDYEGIDVIIRDEEARETRQNWSGFGDPDDARLASVRDARTVTTSYTYHPLGMLESVAMPGTTTRQWSYNAKALLEYEQHPETGRIDYAYDNVGNRTSRTDATNQTTIYGYDNNNRLLTVNYPGTTHDVTFSYDDHDNRRTAVNSFVNSTFVFDAANRLESRTDVILGRTFDTGYVYDANGNLQHLDYPGPLRVTYGYDTGNRITSVVNAAGGNFATNLTYHPNGAIASFLAGNGLTHSFTLDDRNRPKRMWSGTNGAILDLTYTYWNAGNVRWIDDARLGRQSFDYDNVDRLTSASGFWGSGAYSYDNAGNRETSSVGGGSTYSYLNQRLSGISGVNADTFTYLNNGNLQQRGTGPSAQTFTYTPGDMVDTAATPTGTFTYRYDGENMRKAKIGQATQYFIHGGGNQLLAEYEEICAGTARLSRNYIYLGDRLLASVAGPAAPVISFVSSASTRTEGPGTHGVQVRVVTADGSSLPCAAVAQYATAAGTATAGEDFTAATGTITFPVNTASGSTQTINIGMLDDPRDENDETLTLTLSAGSFATVSGSHQITIADNDPTPTISINDANALEGGLPASMAFTVSLSNPSSLEVRVNWATTAGTAAAGVDFTPGSGTLTFPPGSTSQPIAIPVLADSLAETPETFTINLSAPVSATIGDGQGLGTIRDPGPSIVIEAPAHAATVGSSFTLTGYAMDLASTSGTAIDAVHVYIAPTGGSPEFLGPATYGIARPDVAAQWGGNFTNAGFSMSINRTAGDWWITVYAHSTISNWSSTTIYVRVAQPDTRAALEAPAANATAAQPFQVSGWALDATSGSGTGVNLVEVLAYPNPGSGANPITFAATYGSPRQDIANLYGQQFVNSGYQATLRGLAPGPYKLVTRARNSTNGVFTNSNEVIVTVQVNPVMSIDTPAPNARVNQTFMIGGWAIDLAAASGTGVSTQHIWAYPSGGGAAIFLGATNYGGARPDVGAVYGSQFTNSGFGLVATLSPGDYQFVVYSWSILANNFAQAVSRTITVATSSPMMSTDIPGANSTVSQPFAISGWAVDTGAPSGTGIDAVDVYLDASGGPAGTFIGRANVGDRPDVAAWLGQQFLPSGWGIVATGLPPGPYLLNVYIHSTVSGAWIRHTRWITVQ